MLLVILQKPPAAPVVLAAADARADGDLIGIGGFIQWEEGPCTWFSETWTLDDLAVLGLPLQLASCFACVLWCPRLAG